MQFPDSSMTMSSANIKIHRLEDGSYEATSSIKGVKPVNELTERAALKEMTKQVDYALKTRTNQA